MDNHKKLWHVTNSLVLLSHLIATLKEAKPVFDVMGSSFVCCVL